MGDTARRAVSEPNWHGTYNQWTENLAQAVMSVVIFTGAEATSSLVSSGHAQLLAMHPVSRTPQLLVALVARIAALVSASVAGIAVVRVAAFGFYKRAPVAPLMATTVT